MYSLNFLESVVTKSIVSDIKLSNTSLYIMLLTLYLLHVCLCIIYTTKANIASAVGK